MFKLQAVPFEAVVIEDGFWAPRQAVNRDVSLALSLDKLEETGTLGNLRLAAEGAHEGFADGMRFMDSDVYKALEAISYSLATHPDAALEARLDSIIAQLAAAQMNDGYLNSWFQVRTPKEHWSNLRDAHELYCAGHLFEAAVAHFRATGKRSLLDVAVKFADHIDALFGEGKRAGYPGHPEIELALVKLARVTGEPRYFELSRFFLTHRGEKYFAREHDTPLEEYDGRYWQDDVPIREHVTADGHAVRAGYLYSAAVDVAGAGDGANNVDGDAELLAMTRRVWENIVRRRLYLTGGTGSTGANEGFTADYDLPNETAYQETCATISFAMLSQRLNLQSGEARYADYVETALYNGFLAGVSLDGTKYFYDTPLESQGEHHRAPWFGCACCPPNATRTLASLGGYVYATSADGVWINLYIQGEVTAPIGDTKIPLKIETDYPWDGAVQITVNATADFALYLRRPGWCEGATLHCNGEACVAPLEDGYFVLRHSWQSGDTVQLELPMPVRLIEANPAIEADKGRLALMRGPLVYCLEGCDHEVPLSHIVLPVTFAPRAEPAPDLLNGVVVLKGEALAAIGAEWNDTLYRAVAPPRPITVTAVPYYAWDNRAPGAMRVWIPSSV